MTDRSGTPPTSENRTWQASPAMARTVRIVVLVAPVIAGWVSVRLLASVFLHPSGWGGLVLWIVQALAVASLVGTLVDRVAQRALPLATLLGMTLTFPDHAPSRFKLALRTGTIGRLQAELADLDEHGLGADESTAAVRAVELVTMLGRHERLTRGHTERVRAHADVIAGEMGLSDDDRRRLAWGVLLHDIGKLTVPPEILNKKTALTDDEWRILRGHPAAGGRLLRPLASWLGPWHLAAEHHHERWDGRGYPAGLQHAQISLAGRITAVADAYDVMTSRRSYNEPMSVSDARAELVACAGHQFDPAVVRAFLRSSLQSRSRAGLLGWLPELPGLGSAIGAAATTTAAVALSAPLLAPPQSTPTELAYIDAVAEAPPVTPATSAVTSTTTTTPPPSESTTALAVPATDAPSTSVPATTTTLPTTTIAPTTTAAPPPTTTHPTASTTTTLPTTSTIPTTTTTGPTTTTTTTTTAPPPSGPMAVDDDFTVEEDETRQIRVLDNDVFPDAPFASVTVTTQPTHGTAWPLPNGRILLWVGGGYTGPDSLVYEACDTDGACDQATVSIEIIPD